MIYKNEYGEVDFNLDWIKEDVTTLHVSLSGGTDSALVLYMLLAENKNYNIQPYCIIDSPSVHLASMSIIDCYREMFPNIIINDLKYYPKDNKRRLLTSEEKINLTKHFIGEVLKPDIILNGITRSPDLKIQKTFSHILTDRPYIGDDNSNLEPIIQRPNNLLYRPLINVDKRYVAGMYKQLNLMETIYPLTRSCVGDYNVTDYWTKPCKECWWCKEKYWAFGQYDLDG